MDGRELGEWVKGLWIGEDFWGEFFVSIHI